MWAHQADRWSAVTEAGKGYGGNSFHAGYEYRFDSFAVRGGGMYSRKLWNPSAGVGLNMGRRMALDLAIYGNAANIERNCIHGSDAPETAEVELKFFFSTSELL